MKGDFSRLTFRPGRHYAGVFMQQGRVQLDADWNEQTAIAMEAVRALARDLLGPHGGVDGFAVEPHLEARGHPVPWDVTVGAGSYYVEGIRCENAETVPYRALTRQLGCDDDGLKEPGAYLAYLDVWDRLITAVEDPELLEPALGGPDTSTRLQVLWRVRLLDLGSASIPGRRSAEELLVETFGRTGSASLCARVDPSAGFTGVENQLYRIEIHAGGDPANATFVWSRDNGSIVAPVVAIAGDRIEIVPRSAQADRFVTGTWVEPEDEVTTLCARTAPLVRIEAVDANGLVTSPPWPLGLEPGLRRSIRVWDQGAAGDAGRDGAVPLAEGRWIDLDDGIQVWFEEGGDYRTGDYWLIPARPAVGGIEWPTEAGAPCLRPPATVEHHRAPLASLRVGGDGIVTVTRDHRRLFRPLGRTR